MQVTYLGPAADLELPTGVVEKGASIDVSAELAAELIDRGDFAPVKAKKNATNTEESA